MLISNLKKYPPNGISGLWRDKAIMNQPYCGVLWHYDYAKIPICGVAEYADDPKGARYLVWYEVVDAATAPYELMYNIYKVPCDVMALIIQYQREFEEAMGPCNRHEPAKWKPFKLTDEAAQYLNGHHPRPDPKQSKTPIRVLMAAHIKNVELPKTPT